MITLIMVEIEKKTYNMWVCNKLQPSILTDNCDMSVFMASGQGRRNLFYSDMYSRCLTAGRRQWSAPSDMNCCGRL